ncbi:unnamed protein product, partial [Trichogramma brassicae]
MTPMNHELPTNRSSGTYDTGVPISELWLGSHRGGAGPRMKPPIVYDFIRMGPGRFPIWRPRYACPHHGGDHELNIVRVGPVSTLCLCSFYTCLRGRLHYQSIKLGIPPYGEEDYLCKKR